MADIQVSYEELLQEVLIGATAEGCTQNEEFFRLYASLSAECGDSPDLDYLPIENEGLGIRLDGYALELQEDVEGSFGELYLVTTRLFQEQKVPSIVSKDIDRLVNDVLKFLKVIHGEKVHQLEEASNAYQMAMVIRNYIHRVSRIRILVFTNALFKTRKKVLAEESFEGKSVGVNVFDIERYTKISETGNDPVEIDFESDYGGPLPCILASGGEEAYKSYLFALPGNVLADIFERYGNRLLEQNVRTYLQNKTNVNKGILKTIEKEPEMFFAFNNGLTVTASRVEVSQGLSSSLSISRVDDFQIVNGGQTTASLLYAREGMGAKKLSLSKVSVQCKLSEVRDDQISVVVPKISEYANTQNKVSLSDLASNSPVQIKIEQLSKEVSAPTKIGALHSSKWFYERAKGQYGNLTSYKSSSERRKLELEYPKAQLITKTDLAKYCYSYDQLPHIVCLGAQKCFTHFTNNFISKIPIEEITELWFKRTVGKAIIFLTLDKLVTESSWYKSNRGLKAQTVSYTIATCSHQFMMHGHQLDLLRVWKDQAISSRIGDHLLSLAERVQQVLLSPPPGDSNPAMFARKTYCWEVYVRGKFSDLDDGLLEFGISNKEYAEIELSAKADSGRMAALGFELRLVELIPEAANMIRAAQAKGLLSPNNQSALGKLSMGNIRLSKGEMNSLKSLLPRLGVDL